MQHKQIIESDITSVIVPPRLSYSTSAAQSIATTTTTKRKTSRQYSASQSTRLKVSASAAFRSSSRRTDRRPRVGGASSTGSKQSHQQRQLAAATILQRRERLRISDDEGLDVTPRSLIHPYYHSVEHRRTAFDTIGQLASSSRNGSITQLAAQQQQQQARPSLVTVASFSSFYTAEEESSFVSSARVSLKGSFVKGLDADGNADSDDGPSQYYLPRIEQKDLYSANDRITITLKETDTIFLFELAQLTEDASTEAGEAIIAANERYERIKSGVDARKTVDAETQTAQIYNKTRSTQFGRHERRNKATFVNNWVMHDTYASEMMKSRVVMEQVNRFKFTEPLSTSVKSTQVSTSTKPLTLEHQLSEIGMKESYEDATRVTLRILASKLYGDAQKRFAGLIKQDPCDPNLELNYGLDLLWKHENDETKGRSVAAFEWNPVNSSLLAVGYAEKVEKAQPLPEDTSLTPQQPQTPSSPGLVLIWCAKNPSEPDRRYTFTSQVSDLDWSKSRPNLLAVGFYDGVVRVIDASKKQLVIVRESRRKTSPSFDPHWQVQWWPASESAETIDEHLYTSNQDGRVSFYPYDENFSSRELLQVCRIEGSIPGVPRMNHCLGHEIPISHCPGVLLLCRHPTRHGTYFIGTEEGQILRCSISQPHSHTESYLAHDGPIYGLEFSPFCEKLILTCGADWYVRIWAEGLAEEPLLTYCTKMACVHSANWSPRNSTIFASVVANEICIWDIRRKTQIPASITQVSPDDTQLVSVEFTRSGEQLVSADDNGTVYVHALTGMPLPAFDQANALLDAVEKALLTKPELLRKLKKLGPPFGDL